MDEKTKEIIDIFEQISKIPRCSRKEKEIALWIEQWAEDKGFDVKKDETGNLAISVPARPGCENAPIVVLQGHMDMVCEKTPQSSHDFSKDPIRFIIDGDWLHADQTTLGADNGIAIALAMSAAVDPDIKRPPLELLFTVDEESGLVGANTLDPAVVSGKILINMDSEDQNVFTIGCAGGKNTKIALPFEVSSLPDALDLFEIKAGGMKGGHSGIDIHKHRANANIVLTRFLDLAARATEVCLVSFKGGTVHNAIPRDAVATLAFAPDALETVKEELARFEKSVRTEFEVTEPDLFLSIEKTGKTAGEALTDQDTRNILDTILALPNGVSFMSARIEGLVETSSNLATVTLEDGAARILMSQRSAAESRLNEIDARIKSIARLAGADAKDDTEYPAWTANYDSPLLKRSQKIFRDLFGKDPVLEIIHAGLEAGIIGSKCKGMDMIAIGPTIRYPHSPDEKIRIPSILPVWNFLTRLLASYVT